MGYARTACDAEEGAEEAAAALFFGVQSCIGRHVHRLSDLKSRGETRYGVFYARLPPGGSTGQAGVSTRPAGLPHPWGATSRREAAPLTYYGVLLALALTAAAPASCGVMVAAAQGDPPGDSVGVH